MSIRSLYRLCRIQEDAKTVEGCCRRMERQDFGGRSKESCLESMVYFHGQLEEQWAIFEHEVENGIDDAKITMDKTKFHYYKQLKKRIAIQKRVDKIMQGL